MSPPQRLLLGVLAGLWLGTFQSLGPSPFALLEAYAADGALASDAQMPIYKPRKESIDGQMPIYKPRKESTSRARIGGYSRGQDSAAPSLIALVPDHVAFTIKIDTSLCWYLSRQTSRPMTFTVAESQQILPLLETSLPPPIRAGIHCVRLQDYGVTLKEQEQYQWFVTVVVDPDSPSHNVVAGGMIERIPYDEACMLDMPCSWSSCEREAVYRYAESGLWYDAITCLLELIDHDREKNTLQRMLDALLRQSGIEPPI
jgi:hypothetical protein